MDLTDTYNLLYNRFGPQHWWPGDTEYEIVLGAVLTQNTNWGNVEKAIGNLKQKGLLNPKGIMRAKKDALAQLIRPSGYYNQKAERLKAITEWYMKFDRKMKTKELRKELLSIKGVGPETADSILLYALGRPVFVIDAYTKRMCERHGVNLETYDEYQKYFEGRLPRNARKYNEFHALIVRLGKDYCRKKPRCEGCPLENLKKEKRK